MRELIPEKLHNLAKACPTSLYVVGGSVRDYFAQLTPTTHDWDICAPIPAEEFAAIAKNCDFVVKSVFKNTGTVKFSAKDGEDYEYSAFRTDEYVRGIHTPVSTCFTTDITLDAKRRDFTANAVYYDVKNDSFCDPLNGIPAIQRKQLVTVREPERVFGEDGLRLMRLARQAAQLDFFPDEACFLGAKANASLIQDISPERILTELNAILASDTKYGVKDGPYKGICLLEEIGVLAQIMPELTLGKDMTQRPDFHKYTVLEHSLRAVKYADISVRLAALLHDVGKPFCTIRDGNSYAHPVEGARIAKEILLRLKAPNKWIERIPALIQLHMYDFDCNTKENKLRRFFVENYELLDDLLLLKQADFSACADDISPAPTCVKWKSLWNKMQAEGAPLQLRDLAFSGKDALEIGIQPQRIAKTLHALLLHAAVTPADNTKEKLSALAPHFEKTL